MGFYLRVEGMGRAFLRGFGGPDPVLAWWGITLGSEEGVTSEAQVAETLRGRPGGCTNPTQPRAFRCAPLFGKGKKNYMDHSRELVAQKPMGVRLEEKCHAGKGRIEEEPRLQHPSAAAVLQGESLPRAGAQQRPSGWGPREMQPAASPKTFPKGWEGRGPGRPWVAGALRGANRRLGIGQCSGQKVAELTAGVGRCFYLNLSLCPFEMSKQTLCSSS